MNPDWRAGYELYFAYGSNMLSGRLAERKIKAEKLGNATLAGHTLRFHKRSLRDGSGKADAVCTDDTSHLVHGVVFKIDAGQFGLLDEIEGAIGRAPGYSRKEVAVRMADGSVLTAWTYIANAHAIDATLLPCKWYHDLVRYGAEEHGFPEHYRKFIDSFSTATDSEPYRDDKIAAERIIREYLKSRGRV